MFFWLGIAVAGAFAYLAVRIGFFEAWALLVNVVISVYVGIFLTPQTAAIIGGGRETPYCNAIALLVTAGGCFALLYGLSYVFLTGQFKTRFPILFDVVLAGVAGFLTGALVWSFATVAISVLPESPRIMLDRLGFAAGPKSIEQAYLAWWCDGVNTIVGSNLDIVNTYQAIDRLRKEAEDAAPAEPNRDVNPNAPGDSAGAALPNTTGYVYGHEPPAHAPPESSPVGHDSHAALLGLL